jgi:hypothetical protein
MSAPAAVARRNSASGTPSAARCSSSAMRSARRSPCRPSSRPSAAKSICPVVMTTAAYGRQASDAGAESRSGIVLGMDPGYERLRAGRQNIDQLSPGHGRPFDRGNNASLRPLQPSGRPRSVRAIVVAVSAWSASDPFGHHYRIRGGANASMVAATNSPIRMSRRPSRISDSKTSGSALARPYGREL